MNNFLTGPHKLRADDRRILEELGKTHKVISESFKDLNHAEKIKVAVIWLTYNGDVEHDKAARIELSIEAWPAMFYTAEIFAKQSGDGTDCIASTGSGTLAQYMPMFIALAEGMLVIKPAGG